MIGRAEIRGGLLALSGVLIVVLLIVSFTPGLPGEELLQSLRFHFVAVGLVLALLCMGFGARWRGALVLILVLAGGAHGAVLVGELLSRRAETSGEPLARLDFLSFNVLAGNRSAEALVQSIVADPPDVALIMETPGIEKYLDRIAEVLPYSIGCESPVGCDISLHSRFPLEGEVSTLQPFRFQRLALASLSIDGVPLTIVGVHLSKPYFDQAAWRELDQIDDVLGDVEGPLVVAGDFNAAPWSEPLAWLARRNNLAPAQWPPATWPVRLGPLGVPIDNVFTGGTARIESLMSGDNQGSNHRPLRAQIAIYPAP